MEYNKPNVLNLIGNNAENFETFEEEFYLHNSWIAVWIQDTLSKIWEERTIIKKLD